MRRGVITGLAIAAASFADAAHADNSSFVEPVPHREVGYGAAAAESEAPRIRITVSKAADLVGKPVYFEQLLFSDSASITTLSSRPFPRRSKVSASPPAGWPVAAAGVSSGFGVRRHPILGGVRRHAGIDLAARTGTPVVATSDGVVIAAGWRGGYGLLVSLDHGRGVQTRYGHMSRLNVAAGQQVRKGDVIGFVGSTGRSTGSHLHYETRIDGVAVDPMSARR